MKILTQVTVSQITEPASSPVSHEPPTRRPAGLGAGAAPRSPVEQSDSWSDPTTFQSSVHYLNILSLVEREGGTTSNQPVGQTDSSSANDIYHQCVYPNAPPRQLDTVDHTFLTGKGVFSLPPEHCMQVTTGWSSPRQLINK